MKWFIISMLHLPFIAMSQHTIVKGKVTDVNSGDPIPFANVLFQGTSEGTTTDFEGYYEIKTPIPSDTLVVSYIGYQERRKWVQQGQIQTINFQLEEDITNLQEVVLEAGENPAYPIIRQVVKNKKINDKRRLSAYEYDTYTKIEIDVDNINERFRKKKIIQKITQVLDSVDRIAGEDGKPILPLFISESVSKLYYRDNPRLKSENILKSKISGIGVEDGTLVTQFIGSSFQEYNFYQNWIDLVSRDFVSPLADGWRIYYDFFLMDSVYLGEHFCYKLEFVPRSEQDLAFTGTIWITKKEYALKQIDATVGRAANLNFIEKVKIQQELELTQAGAWLPSKNRVLIDIGEINDNMAGMLAKFYTSNRNVIVNKPYEVKFYTKPIVIAEDARLKEDDEYWDGIRHDPLTDTEKSVYNMIDTLQKIPVVKTYTDLVKVVVDGYYNVGKIELGSYLSTIAVNDIEDFRVQLGFKTNIAFSNKWILRGSLGYGFGDEKFKYMGSVKNILSRNRWTTVEVRAMSDIGRVGIDPENFGDNLLFFAASRFGNLRRGYYFTETRFNFQREVLKGLTQKVSVKYNTFRPQFNFAYYSPSDLSLNESYETAELIFETRYARDEIFIQNDNERLSMGTLRWPTLSFRYTSGLKDVWGSDFSYHKFRFNIRKDMRLGILGMAQVNITGETIVNALPYTLLTLHLGNQSPVYASVAYNLMNYGEFVSDRHLAFQYAHHFQGFILNRIPLLKKLQWRLVGTGNVVYGQLREENKSLIAQNTLTGSETLPIGFFELNNPYVELGYGIENIFRFLRVDFVHRISYLDNPDIRKFAVLFSVQFSL